MIYGVTVDDISEPKATLDAIAKIPNDRQVRLVLDKGMWIDHYRDFIFQLDSLVEATILLPVDSSDTKHYTVADYVSRYHRWCLDSSPADIFEVNEINGDWCGPDSAFKASLAMATVQATGRQSLMTLYLEGSDWNSVSKWIETEWLQPMRPMPNHVGISWYPRQANYEIPDWQKVFTELGYMFPTSTLRFSEIGDEKTDDNGKPVRCTKEETKRIIRCFYGAKVPVPRFVGFYGWWSFVEQMVRGPFMPDLLVGCK